MRSGKITSYYALALLAGSLAGREWVTRFARQTRSESDAAAQWLVGLCYHLGHGVRRDLSLARDWYKRSINAGHSHALAGRAELDRDATRRELRSDRSAAVLSMYHARFAPEKLTWKKKEAKAAHRELLVSGAQGDVGAQILLGICAEYGIAVDENWDVALDWFRRAAVQGSEEGCTHFARLSTAMEGDDGAWDRMETRVISILARSSGQKGVEPSGAKNAVKWRLKAAAEGDRFACWRLHELYLLGEGIREDREESAKWLIRACEGHSDETVRDYFADIRSRLAEVIEEHVLDVALRSDVTTSIQRMAAKAAR